ncbi:hypothetical protein LZ31DRAFT_556969 [Colletotrichum somersetense]|nr:hypothetical protein LZ31DRAFT_556969 [Colletotrichum somersetense]
MYDTPTTLWYPSCFPRCRPLRTLFPNHGTYVLPKEFILVDASHLDRSNIQLGSTWNIPKALFALGQAIWGILTIYRTQGEQLQRYGPTAFVMTAAPYAVMSLVNLTVLLVTPECNCIYHVQTPDLDKARRQGGKAVESVAWSQASGSTASRNHSEHFGALKQLPPPTSTSPQFSCSSRLSSSPL